MNNLFATVSRRFWSLEMDWAMKCFTVGVYGWLAGNTLSLWSSYDLIWGEDLVLQRMGHVDGFLNNVAYHLVYTKRWAAVIFHGHWIFALLSILPLRMVWIFRLVVWVFGVMLFYSAIDVFNSAMMIMNLMAFYLIFYRTNVRNGDQFFNRLIYVMCVAQMMVVYLVSAVYKLQGEQWLEGTILSFVVHLRHFVSDGIRDSSWINHPFLLAGLSYLALVYQIVFPFLVWIKKGRQWLLLFGVIFHLCIAVFLHLYDFGLAMIVCYALFLPSRNVSK
jgi:hypothetical protein